MHCIWKCMCYMCPSLSRRDIHIQIALNAIKWGTDVRMQCVQFWHHLDRSPKLHLFLLSGVSLSESYGPFFGREKKQVRQHHVLQIGQTTFVDRPVCSAYLYGI